MNDFDEGPAKIFIMLLIFFVICACLIASATGAGMNALR